MKQIKFIRTNIRKKSHRFFCLGWVKSNYCQNIYCLYQSILCSLWIQNECLCTGKRIPSESFLKTNKKPLAVYSELIIIFNPILFPIRQEKKMCIGEKYWSGKFFPIRTMTTTLRFSVKWSPPQCKSECSRNVFVLRAVWNKNQGFSK